MLKNLHSIKIHRNYAAKLDNREQITIRKTKLELLGSLFR